MNKRWYNYRPILLFFIFLILGTLFAFYVQDNRAASIGVIVPIFILVSIVAICKKKLNYLLIPTIAFLIAGASFYLAVSNFNKAVKTAPEIIEARVYSITEVEQGMLRFKADTCKFDGKSIDTNINVLLYDYDSLFADLQIGMIVKFKPSKFYKADLKHGKTPNSKMFSEDLKYTVTANVTQFEVIGTNTTFVEQIKQKIKDNLGGGLTSENMELAYSALFGDKDFLNETQYSSYRLSGIAHLLAVSGLHVSIIVAIISALLNAFKFNGWLKLAIVSLFLIFYAYLCNFSVSVIRAGVMSLMLMLSVLLKREYDALSALGLAGIIIFFLNPLCVFDVSFLMSFACVLGIILFSKPISALFHKCKMPKKLADSMAITTSTLISLLFISAYFFNNFNLISLIANLIIIPIFTLAFSIMFVVSIISLALPAISVVLIPLNYVFDLINVLATVLGGLSFANFSTAKLEFLAIPLYFVLLFSLSRISVAKYRNKIIISIPLVAILMICLI